MKLIIILFAFLGVGMATSQSINTQIEEVPIEFAPLTQAKIIELYEFLKTELEGEDINDLEPEIVDQTLRKKRSAEASPFFLRHLFRNSRRYNNHGHHHNNYGYGHRNYHGHQYGHRNHYGHGYNRGYRNYGRHYYH